MIFKCKQIVDGNECWKFWEVKGEVITITMENVKLLEIDIDYCEDAMYSKQINEANHLFLSACDIANVDHEIVYCYNCINDEMLVTGICKAIILVKEEICIITNCDAFLVNDTGGTINRLA